MIKIILMLLLSACGESGNSQINNARSDNGLAYDLTGTGPLIVFIHGSNLDRRMWNNEVNFFGPKLKVLRYDLRGMGNSDKAVEKYSDHNDLLNLLDEIGEREVTLVGLSAGSQVALDFAIAFPDRLQKLILVSPSLNGYVPAENPPYLVDLINAIKSRDYNKANEVLLNSSIMSVPEEYAILVRNMVNESRQWTLPYSLIIQNSVSAIENLEKIKTPVLLLVGENDISAIRDLGKLLEDRLPNANRVVIPNGTHLLNLVNPDGFHREISAFLGLPVE